MNWQVFARAMGLSVTLTLAITIPLSDLIYDSFEAMGVNNFLPVFVGVPLCALVGNRIGKWAFLREERKVTDGPQGQDPNDGANAQTP